MTGKNHLPFWQGIGLQKAIRASLRQSVESGLSQQTFFLMGPKSCTLEVLKTSLRDTRYI